MLHFVIFFFKEIMRRCERYYNKKQSVLKIKKDSVSSGRISQQASRKERAMKRATQELEHFLVLDAF